MEFNIVLSSHQNRSGRSTVAKILSKLLHMPKTSGGDMHRLFALEYFKGFDRGQLVKEFIENQDLAAIFEKYGNISSEEYVEFHEHVVKQDPFYDHQIDEYLIKCLMKKGWIIDSVIGVSMIHYLTDNTTKLNEYFLISGKITLEDAKNIQKDTETVYFLADIDIRAKRSASYEESFGHETSVANEKTLLLERQNENEQRYQEIYGFKNSEGQNLAKLVVDSSVMNPIEIATEIVSKSDKIQSRLKELGIADYKAAISEIADW